MNFDVSPYKNVSNLDLPISRLLLLYGALTSEDLSAAGDFTTSIFSVVGTANALSVSLSNLRLVLVDVSD